MARVGAGRPAPEAIGPTSTLRAYHGDPDLKDCALGRMRAARVRGDVLAREHFGPALGMGSPLGAVLDSFDGGHELYEHQLGIPAVLADLEARLAHYLPPDEAERWPERFLQAIPVGADLALAWPRFAVWLLSYPDHGASRLADQSVCLAIERVVGLYQRVLRGQRIPRAGWEEASAAASERTLGVTGIPDGAAAAAAAARAPFVPLAASNAVTHITPAPAGAATSRARADRLIMCLRLSR